MKMKASFPSVTAAALSVLILFSTVSCDKEKVEERPELPPAESLMMDFSDFSEAPDGATAKGTAATYENFLYSYLTVGFWSLTATVVSVVPVAAYSAALQETPEYIGDQTWEWSFDFPINSINYTATLTAQRISNEEFTAEMVIALAALPNQGTKWFDGTVRYDLTQAEWTIYKEGTTEVLQIVWNKNYESDAADLTYTYVEAGQAETGSYIRWEHIPGAALDAAYTIDIQEGMVNIEWSTETKEGRVMSPSRFGDSDWHCWDTKANGLIDKECS